MRGRILEQVLYWVFFIKNGPNPASFGLFSFFSPDKCSTNTINDKSVDGVLGTRTRGGRMVGADESTELYRHPMIEKISCYSTMLCVEIN